MTTRRDAIARNLCARICDERRSVLDLKAVDAVLTAQENDGGEAMQRLVPLIPDLSPHEVLVVQRMMERLHAYSSEYGRLNLANDHRDFRQEGGAELSDWLFYFCANEVKECLKRDARIDSAPARADSSHGNPQAGGGTFSRVELGLRELAAAKPQVAAPGVADDHTLWSAEMVDGRFDGSSDE